MERVFWSSTGAFLFQFATAWELYFYTGDINATYLWTCVGTLVLAIVVFLGGSLSETIRRATCYTTVLLALVMAVCCSAMSVGVISNGVKGLAVIVMLAVAVVTAVLNVEGGESFWQCFFIAWPNGLGTLFGLIFFGCRYWRRRRIPAHS